MNNFEIPILINYADRFLRAISTFDIDSILKQLSQFTGIINELKKMEKK
ncbi:MAG: hypothetical protein JXB17_09450 [Bacteroidales bacterium]|nr:hypothetical protein [Bacteroidales bacterium]